MEALEPYFEDRRTRADVGIGIRYGRITHIRHERVETPPPERDRPLDRPRCPIPGCTEAVREPMDYANRFECSGGHAWDRFGRQLA